MGFKRLKFTLLDQGLTFAAEWTAEFPAAASKLLRYGGAMCRSVLGLIREEEEIERAEEKQRQARYDAEIAAKAARK